MVSRATAFIVQAQLAERERSARLEAERVGQELRRRESEYRALAESMPHIVWSALPDGRFDYFNHEFARYAGIPVEEATGDRWQNSVLPEDLPITLARWSEGLQKGIAAEVEHRIRRADGTYRWFLSRVVPLRDEHDTLVKWLGTSTDIDDRKREEARLSALASTAALGSSLDERTTLIRLADLMVPALADVCVVDLFDERGAADRLTGVHRDPALAPVAEALRAMPPRPDSKHVATRAFATTRAVFLPDFTDDRIAGESDSPAHAAIIQKIQLRSLISVPLVSHGRSIATVTFAMCAPSGRRYAPEDLMLATEIANRVAHVIENARLYRRLQQSEARFRLALGSSNVVVFEQDEALRYRWIYNSRGEGDDASIVGKTDADRFSDAEAAAHLTALKRRVLDTGERLQEEVRMCEDGEVRHSLLSLEAVHDPSGAITGVVGVAADITATKRAQEELAAALDYRDQIIGILGHDLRNPLSSISIGSSLLLKKEGIPEGVRKAAMRMHNAAERMNHMIRDLLDFSQARFHDTLPMTPAPANIHGVCRAVVEELEIAHPDRTIELALSGNGQGTWDENRLAQVVSNLVGNALRYGDPSQPVRLTVEDADQSVMLRVINQGPPIPAEVLPAIFEPFRRGADGADAVARQDGLGLGLYIVKQIAVAHGGTISVESSAEAGTTFTVRLPKRGG